MTTEAETIPPMQILHRFTNAVIFEAAVKTKREAVLLAIKQGISLSGANLSGANLSGANLSGANLSGANLSGAYLSGANLSDANLSDAYLSGANLSDAYLSGANLRDAYLRGANLRDANLSGANLRGANLRDANLSGAKGLPADIATAPTPTPIEIETRRRQDMMLFRERNPGIPVVEQLDAKILDAINSGRGELKMDGWHGSGGACGTTHCRAGWAISLAGTEGIKLEQKFGPEFAGAKIYRASTGNWPNFFASDEDALADIKACAAAQDDVTF